MRNRIFVTCFILLISIQSVLATTEQQSIRATYAINEESKFGFSSYSVNTADPVEPVTIINFQSNSSGQFITDEFFIFWQLYDSSKVKISLQMTSLVKDGTKKIDYKINDLYSISSTSQDVSATTVLNESSGTITGCRIGSAPLSLIFMDVGTNSNDTTGIYEGTLTLTMETL